MPARVTDDVILDAVVATVGAHGYAGATTRQIAEAGGVNEVTLFRRFGSKRNLVRAAIRRDLDRLGDLDALPSEDLEADLLQVLVYYADLFSQRHSLPLALMLEATRNADVAALIAEPVAAQHRLTEIIAAFQRKGQLVAGSPERLVNAIVGPLLAYAVDAALGFAAGSPPDPSQLLRGFLDGHAGCARNAGQFGASDS